MNWPSIVLWGFAATLALTALMRGSQAFGFTRMDIPFMLGTVFTPDRDRAKVYGFLVHLVNGWLFSFVYALLFDQLGYATWWWGTLVGLGHGGFVLMLPITMLPGIHPRMASTFGPPGPPRLLEPPGFLALNYGRGTPLVTILAHGAYGAIIGALYSVT